MLESLLRQEEGKTLEFKENVGSLHGILKTIIAFANTAGGTLVIGIKDKTKEVIGISDILKEEERIASAVADSIAPLMIPNFQLHTWRNRDVLMISVAYAPAPYYLKSKDIEHGVYVRLGSTNRTADRATISEIQRLAIHQGFDELPNLHAQQDDLNFVLAKELFARAAKKFDLNVAKSLHLLVSYQSHDYPSNGALLLFGKDHRRFLPDVLIRCGCFAGTTKTHIIDQQDIEDILPIAVDKALSFVERNTAKKSKIGRMHRTDIPQYPAIVVREAIINSIVHADYSIKGSSIQIAIFSDRLEITNPGALPYGLSLEKALSGISQLRNHIIGRVFRELGLIERWGSGLGRMIETCREQNITEPKFEELDRYFRVTLYHDKKPWTAKEPWQREAIKYLQSHENLTTKDAAKLWQVTERTASTRLKKMLENGFVVEVGTGHYDPRKKFILAK